MLNKIRIKNVFLQYLTTFFSLNFVLTFLLLILFLSSFISNYNHITILFKLLLSIITILVIIILSKIKGNKIIISFSNWEKILIIFLIYSSLSIVWSNNTNFGLLKLLQIVVVLFPLWLSIRQKIYIYIKNEIKILLYIFLSLNFIIAIYIIFLNPVTFSKTGIESRTISQVFSGRLLTLSILSILYLIFIESKKNLITYLSLITFSLALGLISFRAGIISLIIILSIMLLLMNEKKLVLKYFLTILISIYLSTFLNDNLISRMNWITEIEKVQNLSDNTVNARIKATLISFEMFTDNPISGVGLGGFNIEYNGDDIGLIIKYPHNLFLELLCELGLPGFLMFLILLIKSFHYFKVNNLFKVKYSFYLFFLLFILSQFSKDLSTNIVLILPALIKQEEFKV